MSTNNSINSTQTLDPSATPQFTGLNLSSLAPSEHVGTDGSKNLINIYTPIGRMFMQTANGTAVTATTTETTILGSGEGSLTFPANSFEVSAYCMELTGPFGADGTDTMTVRIKMNSVVLLTLVVDLDNATSKSFDLEINFTIRAIGAATVASVATDCQFTSNQNGANAFVGDHSVNVNSTTFDTTVSNTLDVTVEFSTASASNTIQTYTANLFRVY